MSGELIRRLSGRIRVPEQYAGGVGRKTKPVVEGGKPVFEQDGTLRREPVPVVVDGVQYRTGADAGEVANAGSRLLARFNNALNDYQTTKQTLLTGDANRKPQPPEVAEYNALKQLDGMAELVRRFAIEAGPDGSGAVIADMAAALGSLEKPQLAMILRRAGNPPLFQPLLGGDLPDVPMLRKADKAAAASEVGQEIDKAKFESSVKSLPMIMHPSSNYSKPGDSDAYRSFKPKDHDPINTDTTRLIKDRETGEWREFRPRPVVDGEGRIVFEADKVDDVDKDTIAATGRQDSTNKELLNRMAGDQIAQSKKLKPGERLTVGAGATGDSDWVSRNNKQSKNPDKGKPIDQVVEKRNKGAFRKLQEVIEAASFDFDADGREVRSNKTFDLDKHFPRWRARVGELDESGKMAYPAQMPTAEYVTGMILGMHNWTEPGLFQRYLPVIERSIAAASTTPSTAQALHYSKTVHVPSPSFRKVMEEGVGSADYPYKIYGPRKADVPSVTEPTAAPAKAETPQQPESRESTLERLKRIRQMQGKPGIGDQSSIYTVPDNSPMSGLLA